MASDLGLLQNESVGDPACQTASHRADGFVSRLALRIAAGWRHLRAGQDQRRLTAALRADVKSLERTAPQLLADVGLVDRATAASVRRMESAAACGTGLSRHTFMTRL
jgi:hypothetical protein